MIVNIDNVNEPPNVPAKLEFLVPELLKDGDLMPGILFSSLVSDPDDGDTLQFFLLNCDGTSLCPFVLDSSTNGQLLVSPNITLDFEAINEFVFQVRAQDLQNLDVTENVTIKLQNINEGPFRKVTEPSVSIPEGSAVGTLILDLNTILEDADGQTLVFNITGGNENGKFRVSSLGFLVVNGDLDYEREIDYNLTILAKDPEDLQLEHFVLISVENVNDVEILNISPQLLQCDTPTTITITGKNFGFESPPPGTITAVTATYTSQSDGRSYNASSCQVSSGNTEITCETQPGVGVSFT